MTKNISELFYDRGGYTSASEFSGQDNYISVDDCTGTYVPMGLQMINSLCDITTSVTYGSTMSTGDNMDNLIISELSLYIADSSYDKIHIDPESGEMENRHWDLALSFMIAMYGEDGELPGAKDQPYCIPKIATMSV